MLRQAAKHVDHEQRDVLDEFLRGLGFGSANLEHLARGRRAESVAMLALSFPRTSNLLCVRSWRLHDVPLAPLRHLHLTIAAPFQPQERQLVHVVEAIRAEAPCGRGNGDAPASVNRLADGRRELEQHAHKEGTRQPRCTMYPLPKQKLGGRRKVAGQGTTIWTRVGLLESLQAKMAQGSRPNAEKDRLGCRPAPRGLPRSQPRQRASNLSRGRS